jgi:L-seryl-tRNA(Ser) seleniumtransferase
MAIKPPEILNKLPSVSELLDKPQVRALVERWNRSVVVNGVRSYLDEVRADLERRAADLPSIRELAERAAGYIVSRQHHSLGVAVNATGQLCGSTWSSMPLCEPALERMISLGREFAVASASGFQPGSAEGTLCRLTGAEAAVVANSYSSAIWLVLAALGAERDVVVARAEVGEVDGTDSLPKLAAAVGATLKEIGATNRSAVSDYEEAISPRSAAILKLSTDAYRVVGETGAAPLEDLVSLASGRELCLIDALGAAPLVDPPTSITGLRRSAQASLAAGADVVILRGDGLASGPACGIVLGRKEFIERVGRHPLFHGCRLDALREAALTATAECYDNPSRGADTLPVWQCLTTSIENLKNRAERMASQLAHAEGVATATAIEMRSPLSAALNGDGWPSYGVALTAKDGSIGLLDTRLRTARFPVLGRIEGDRLILDLRTVLPRQDKTIVDSLLGA